MKKKNNKDKNTYSWIYLIIPCLLIGLGFVYFYTNGYKSLSSNKSYQELNTKPQVFTAQFLKFQIQIPNGFIVEDGYSTVSIKNGNKLIEISRNGTNFTDLEGYLDDLGKKNSVKYKEIDKFIVNNSNVIKAEIVNNNGKIIERYTYFIYSNFAVYSFATSSPELHLDLDTIVRSFKVLP